jgi:hypothetical protein
LAKQPILKILLVTPAFEILDKGKTALVGSKWIPCHMAFDIKIDFTRKVIFVACGHTIEPPISIMYSSVIVSELCFILLTSLIYGYVIF